MKLFHLILLACLVASGCQDNKEPAKETGASPSAPHGFISPIDGKEMVRIPAGPFFLGTDKTDPEKTHLKIGTVKPLYLDQQPKQKVELEEFYIDKYEVTNGEYRRFIEDTRFNEYPTDWVDGMLPPGLENHPVTSISWREALAYALWAGKTLPTEEQWEKAARGEDGRDYPWGNSYKKGYSNMGLDGIKESAPVGSYPEDKSPYGVMDMAGNVMEWTLSWYEPYPGSEYKSKRMGNHFKILRGTGFQTGGHYFLDAYRYVFHRTEVDPDEYYDNVGFRCVLLKEKGS